MKLFLLFTTSVFYISGFAQQVYISDHEKLSAEMVGYDILGASGSGDVYIYKKYRFEDKIDIYDREMNLKRSKNITRKNINYETNEVIKMGDRIFQFYTEKSGKASYLKYQLYNLDMEDKEDPVLIDSTVSKVGEGYSEYRIIRSEQDEYMLCYKFSYNNSRIEQTFLQVVNREGKVMLNSSFYLPRETFSGDLVRADISNSGRPVFLFRNLDYSCKKDKGSTSFWFAFPGPGNTAETALSEVDDLCIKELGFSIDQKNSMVVAAGFTGEDTRYSMKGYLTMQIDLASGAVMQSADAVYQEELYNSITSMLDKSFRYIPAYQVTKVIPRMDGGMLVVGEYYDKSVENYDYTNYDPYYGYRTSTRQVEFYEYSDILLLSVNPDGGLDWSNIIRKKQLSKEDKGVSSSFGVLNGEKELHFVFNEDITQNSNVLMYTMAADGTLDRQSLFNPSKQEVELRPVSARQIAYNEIIIPSIYKRNLAFVKIKL
jgi:hypothetical protein